MRLERAGTMAGQLDPPLSPAIREGGRQPFPDRRIHAPAVDQD